MRTLLPVALVALLAFAALASARAAEPSAAKPDRPADNTPPPGFVALFNGRDLTGWKGLLKEPFDNPARRAKLSREEAADLQKEANAVMRKGWRVEKGMLIFNGRGRSLCTAKDYGDFEMYVDWKIQPHGDSGIYLRGARRCSSGTPSPSPPRTAAKSAPAACTTTRNTLPTPNSSPITPSANGIPSISKWSATRSP